MQQTRITTASCQVHGVDFCVPEGRKALCPVCDTERALDQARRSVEKLANANRMLQNELERLRIQVDQLAAMRSAFDVISVEDLTFVKSVVYRWQADHGDVALKPTHGVVKSRKRGAAAPVDGFLAMYRSGGEPEVHQCNSVGGLALAAYLEEAMSIQGSVKAMELLVRAALQHLRANVDA